MKDVYSLYEAKAKLSEIIRQVRERGRTATITYRGEPVAEIRPLAREDGSLAEHLDELASAGALQRRRVSGPLPEPLARRPGALNRFLDERE